MKVGIYFGDNDFWKTAEAFLKLLKESNIDEDYLTKHRVMFLWNQLSVGLYYMKQNKFEYYGPLKDNYLDIDLDNVYFNEEVDEKLLEDNNGEFSWIEL